MYFQEVYHAIANVGTLLLELGDVGKQFFINREESEDSLVSAAVAAHSSRPLLETVGKWIWQMITRLGNLKSNKWSDSLFITIPVYLIFH